MGRRRKLITKNIKLIRLYRNIDVKKWKNVKKPKKYKKTEKDPDAKI